VRWCAPGHASGSRGRRGPDSTPPTDRNDSTDPADSADRTDSVDSDDPMLNADAKDPTDPTDKKDPTDPTDRADPRDPIDRKESCDHSDHFDEDFMALFSPPADHQDTVPRGAHQAIGGIPGAAARCSSIT
jgi:hypothetical protein